MSVASFLLSLLLSLLVASVAAQDCKNGIMDGVLNIKINGTTVGANVAQSGGNQYGGIQVSGDTVTIQHGPRIYLAQRCDTSFQPTTFLPLMLLDKTLSYDVDLSKVGCACNAALYLVAMPAYNSQNQPDATKCGDYYCDANKVCGVDCPEMDIMEANDHAWQTTPHKCDAPQGNYYANCDGGGCGRNTYRLNPNAYGPGSQYIINTQSKFSVAVTFQTSGGNLAKITTTLTQNGKIFSLINDDSCGGGYLASMTQAFQKGMTLTVSYWGTDAQTMSWLDIPPCDSNTACNTNSAFSFGNIQVS